MSIIYAVSVNIVVGGYLVGGYIDSYLRTTTKKF